MQGLLKLTPIIGQNLYHQSALLNFTTTVKLHAGADLRDYKDLEIFLSQLNLSVNPRMIAIIINVMEIHHNAASY